MLFVCVHCNAKFGGKGGESQSELVKINGPGEPQRLQSSWPFESKADTKAESLISPQTSQDSGCKGNVSFDADEIGTRPQGRTLSVGM